MDVGDEIGEKLVKESLEALRFMAQKASASIPGLKNSPSGSLEKPKSDNKTAKTLSSLEGKLALEEEQFEPIENIRALPADELASLEVSTVEWDRDCDLLTKRLCELKIPFEREVGETSVVFTVKRTDVEQVIGVAEEFRQDVNGFNAKRFLNMEEFSSLAKALPAPEYPEPLELEDIVPDISEEDIKRLENMVIEWPLENKDLAEVTALSLETIACPHELICEDGEFTILAKASDLMVAQEYIPMLEAKWGELVDEGFFRNETLDSELVKPITHDSKTKALPRLDKPYVERNFTPKRDIAQGKEIAAIQAQEEMRKHSLTRGGR